MRSPSRNQWVPVIWDLIEAGLNEGAAGIMRIVFFRAGGCRRLAWRRTAPDRFYAATIGADSIEKGRRRRFWRPSSIRERTASSPAKATAPKVSGKA